MFRILSIDGGGIKGLFPAALLAEMEQAAGAPLSSYFDLMAGTSTGGIIAICLGLGLGAAEIMKLYESKGTTIFPSATTLSKKLSRIWRAKHSTAPLRSVLQQILGNSRLGDSKTRLLIPAMSADTGSVYIYKTAHHPHLRTDWKKPAIEAALATSAAPTYLAPYVTSTGGTLLDGGMWAANPTGFAVVEAIGLLGMPRDDIQTLSIGCTQEPANFLLRNQGLIGWGTRAIEAAFAGQSHGSLGCAALLTSHAQLMRIDPPVGINRFKLDDAEAAKSLPPLARETFRNLGAEIVSRFLMQPTTPFTPCY